MKLAATLFSLMVLGSVGCKDAPPEAYATYQECFDDHVMKESLPVKEAIVVCCLEHPIDGHLMACGVNKPDCINYLTASLNQTSASTTDVMEACADYVTKMSM